MHFIKQNCIFHFPIQSKRGLLTAMASCEGHEAKVVTRHPMVYSLLRKQHSQFYSMYSEQGSQHPSSEQSHTVKCHSTCILPISIAKKDSIQFTVYYPIVQWAPIQFLLFIVTTFGLLIMQYLVCKQTVGFCHFVGWSLLTNQSIDMYIF